MTSYQALVDRYFHTAALPSDVLEMRFVSPTTFHSGDFDMPLPLPTPERVLRSWLKRWNCFSSASLPHLEKELKEARLALNRYQIESDTVQYRETLIGCVGTCRFRVLAQDEFWVRLCNLLADYSFYCGTGYKTTYGLGQTIRADGMD
jgi:CRISPR-associated endoribonuclease Cas6